MLHRQRSPSEQKLSDYKMSDYKNLKGFYNPKGNVKCKKVLGREKKQEETVGSQCNLSCHPSDNWLPGDQEKGPRSQPHSTRREADETGHVTTVTTPPEAQAQDVQRRAKPGAFLQGLPDTWTWPFFSRRTRKLLENSTLWWFGSFLEHEGNMNLDGKGFNLPQMILVGLIDLGHNETRRKTEHPKGEKIEWFPRMMKLPQGPLHGLLI